MTDIPAVSGSDTGTWKSLINTLIGLLNNKINARPYIWANAAARTAQTGMTIGEYGYQTDTQVTYRATSSTATVAWSSPWITFTLTPASGLVVGTGGAANNAAAYKYENGMVRVHFLLTLGSSGASVTAGPIFNLPVTAVATDTPQPQFPGAVSLYDTSAGSPYAALIVGTGSSTTQWRILLNGTLGIFTGITNVSPFTWAAGDSIQGEFVYRPA